MAGRETSYRIGLITVRVLAFANLYFGVMGLAFANSLNWDVWLIFGSTLVTAIAVIFARSHRLLAATFAFLAAASSFIATSFQGLHPMFGSPDTMQEILVDATLNNLFFLLELIIAVILLFLKSGRQVSKEV